MAEAERYLPEFTSKLEGLLEAHDLTDLPLSLRISGCPNGCSRPYLAELALVGKAPGRYNLHIGGNADGSRLNLAWLENVDEPQMLQALDGLLARFARERASGERLGDFALRAGVVDNAAAATSASLSGAEL
jgi:sulfite reductase (NADPH) hemoprotein beta-component